MYKHLVFSGGGPRVLTFLSSIEVLSKANLLTNIKHYWGNSGGAILATLLSMETPLPKIRTVFETFDFTKLRDIDISHLLSFGDHWGLDSGTAFYEQVTTIMEDIKPGSSEFTLQELPSLHITATDLSLGKPVILDSKTMPTMKVIDALRASTSIPFFYKPFRNPINKHLLVDGAVACNFPWILLPSDAERKEALGFDFHTGEACSEPKTLGEFIPSILNFRERLWNSHLLKPKAPNILRFYVSGFPAWHLALKKEDRDELFHIGFNYTTEWVKRHSAPRNYGKPPPYALPGTLQQPVPSDHTKLSLDSHAPGHPSLPQHPSRHSPSQYLPGGRRWSV